jgi:hypothetical protein
MSSSPVLDDVKQVKVHAPGLVLAAQGQGGQQSSTGLELIVAAFSIHTPQDGSGRARDGAPSAHAWLQDYLAR